MKIYYFLIIIIIIQATKSSANDYLDTNLITRCLIQSMQTLSSFSESFDEKSSLKNINMTCLSEFQEDLLSINGQTITITKLLSNDSYKTEKIKLLYENIIKIYSSKSYNFIALTVNQTIDNLIMNCEIIRLLINYENIYNNKYIYHSDLLNQSLNNINGNSKLITDYNELTNKSLRNKFRSKLIITNKINNNNFKELSYEYNIYNIKRLIQITHEFKDEVNLAITDYKNIK